MMRNKNHKKRYILLLIIVASLVAGGFFGYRTWKNSDDIEDKWVDGVNYRPPTEQERVAGDEQKKQLSEKSEDSQNSSTNEDGNHENKKDAAVIITDAAQYDDIIEVRAFIPNFYQNGTCTITFTKAELSVTKSTPAYADSSNTICTNPEIKRSEFPSSGNWQVSVAYESEDAKGTSDQQTITIK